MDAPQLYLLLDANVFAGFYAPQTLTPATRSSAERMEQVVESVRKGGSPHLKLLVPEICVAEAQTVLSKHANPKWKGKRKRDDPQAIHGTTYKTLVKCMRADLHGGQLIESVPLQRYHVLAKHLITPVDHHLRLLKEDGRGYVKELGGTDQLICGMAVWLTKLLGQGRLVVVTTDYRMVKVLEKARKVTAAQAEKWGILDVAKDIGFAWSTDIYPRAVHLSRIGEAGLRELLGSWPLPQKQRPQREIPRRVTDAEVELLVARYRAIGIGRDRLPYSPQMSALRKQFNSATGHSLTEGDVWRLLIDRLKRGRGRLRTDGSPATATPEPAAVQTPGSS